MTDQIKTDATVTISLDIEELLKRGNLLGYQETRYGDEEPQFADSLIESIIQAAAAKVSAVLLKDEFRAVLNEAMTEQVGKAVTEALDRPVQRTDEWGTAKGEAKPLREQVIDKANDTVAQWMKLKRGDFGYNRQSSSDKYFHEVVDKAVREDLNSELAKAREAVTARVKAESARLVAEAASKAVRL